MKIGFENFCKDHKLSGEVTADFKNREIKKERYTLFRLSRFGPVIERTLQNLILGSDYGIISYNETPKIVENGITTISTNFENMGKNSSQMILKGTKTN
jgi:hypothetical protein